MASASTTCPSCCKKYAGVSGEDARKPVVLTCLCVFCKGCALQEEAKAQQQQPPAEAAGGKKGKGKKKKKKGEKAEYIPTPCMSCSKHCAVPVNELKLDVAAMKEVDGCGGDKPQHKVPTCTEHILDMTAAAAARPPGPWAGVLSKCSWMGTTA